MVLWIFGYGSLIWTPDFHYDERVSGYVKNYRRAFAKVGSDERNGSVALNLTLEPREGEITGGVAYRVSAEVEEQILSSSGSKLNESESLMLDFFTPEESQKPAVSGVLTYIAPPPSSNLWYIGLSNVVPSGTTNTSRHSKDGAERISKNEPRIASRGRRVSKQDRCRERMSFEPGNTCIRQ